MASETVDSIDWPHPPHPHGQYPLRFTYCTVLTWPTNCKTCCTNRDSNARPRVCQTNALPVRCFVWQCCCSVMHSCCSVGQGCCSVMQSRRSAEQYSCSGEQPNLDCLIIPWDYRPPGVATPRRSGLIITQTYGCNQSTIPLLQ